MSPTLLGKNPDDHNTGLSYKNKWKRHVMMSSSREPECTFMT